MNGTMTSLFNHPSSMPNPHDVRTHERISNACHLGPTLSCLAVKLDAQHEA